MKTKYVLFIVSTLLSIDMLIIRSRSLSLQNKDSNTKVAIFIPDSPAVKIQFEGIEDRYGNLYEVFNFKKVHSAEYKIAYRQLLGYVNEYGKILIPIKDWDFIGRPLEGVIPYSDSSETGYYDVKTGKKFDFTHKGFRFYSNFKHGRALATMNGKFGLVNKAGNIIIPFVYTDFERLGEHNAEMKDSKIIMYYGGTKTIINHQTGKICN